MSLFRSPADGKTYDVPPEQADRKLAEGYIPVSADDRAAEVTSEALDARNNERGIVGTINAGATSALGGITGGASDILLRGLLDKGQFDRLRGEREAHPIASTVGDIAGTIAPAILSGGSSLAAKTPAGAIARLGAGLAESAPGASTIAKVGRAVGGGAVEGALYGAGSGISELAYSQDPLTFERAASVLSSKMLYGGAIGGVAGGLAKAAEVGLAKAKGVIDSAAEAHAARAAVPEDLAGLDAKGLRAAKESELAAIETARVPQRQALADDLATFHADLKEQKIWLATRDSTESEIRTIGKQSLNADRQLAKVLDNPKYLADNPKTAMAALQKQEHALEQLSKKSESLGTAFAVDETGVRKAALDAVPAALERNRGLQSRIAELVGEKASPRLSQIADAVDSLASGGAKKSIAEQMLHGSVFGGVAGVVGSVPVIGHMLAPFAGAAAAKMVGEKVFGRMSKAIGAAAERSQSAVAAFVDVSGKTLKHAPVLATKVLGSVAYAPAQSGSKPSAQSPKQGKLPEVYRARADEIRSQVARGPDGVARVRPEARAAMAARLDPIRTVNPILADRMETHAAARLEFLAGKLPTRPDLAAVHTGPDRWQPSDMEMRTFARYAAAVEDPHAIVERLASGAITPEDAEVMRKVYPEMMADITKQIVMQLPKLQKSLPYQRRLALSIFSGVPVDPAMNPRILSALQRAFSSEPGTEGGTQAPRAAPQFGSVSKQEPTPAQKRAG